MTGEIRSACYFVELIFSDSPFCYNGTVERFSGLHIVGLVCMAISRRWIQPATALERNEGIQTGAESRSWRLEKLTFRTRRRLRLHSVPVFGVRDKDLSYLLTSQGFRQGT